MRCNPSVEVTERTYMYVCTITHELQDIAAASAFAIFHRDRTIVLFFPDYHPPIRGSIPPQLQSGKSLITPGTRNISGVNRCKHTVRVALCETGSSLSFFLFLLVLLCSQLNSFMKGNAAAKPRRNVRIHLVRRMSFHLLSPSLFLSFLSTFSPSSFLALIRLPLFLLSLLFFYSHSPRGGV